KSNVTTTQQVGVLQDRFLPLLKLLIGDEDQQNLKTTGFTCDSTNHPLICVASNPVKIDTKTMEIYMSAPFDLRSNGQGQNVQVLPHTWTRFKQFKAKITPVKFLHKPPQIPSNHCDNIHTIPAIVFSTGGYTENLYHAINDVIIPLFITSHIFNSQVQFVITDYKPAFVKKFEKVFSSLSNYNLLNVNSNKSIHCFPAVVVGLKFHSELSINYSEVPRGNSIINFRKFLATTYGLKPTNVSYTTSTSPVLLFLSRRGTRMFSNEDEMVDMMEDLGFDVIVARSYKKMAKLENFAKLLSTCSVLVGAHGAGLTNMVFLPPGAVLVQVVPLGVDFHSRVYFGDPPVRMGLHYLKYKITPNESSLVDLYPRDDPVFTNEISITSKGYTFWRQIYLQKQNIKVDVKRFRGTLVEALRLLGRSNPLRT
ncbi:alpha-1,3-arabinosyltransferase XAT3-like protein, partial [Tanacetum coccineum]